MGKTFGVVGVLALVLVLPVAVFLVGQNQNPGSKAANNVLLPDGTPAGFVAEDAFVDEETPSKNFGLVPTLWADGQSRKITYIKLNLSSLAGKEVKKAVLKLYVTHESSGLLEIKEVPASSWTEKTITYSVRPLTGDAITSVSGGVAGSWVEIDLTEFVRKNAGGVASLAIESSDPNGLAFNSVESPFNKLELVVDEVN